MHADHALTASGKASKLKRKWRQRLQRLQSTAVCHTMCSMCFMRPATRPNAPSPPPRTALPRRASAARRPRAGPGTVWAAAPQRTALFGMRRAWKVSSTVSTHEQTDKQTNRRTGKLRARRYVRVATFRFRFGFPLLVHLVANQSALPFELSPLN